MRTARTEGTERTIDQSRIEQLQVVESKALLRQAAAAKRFDHDIGLGRETADRFGTRGRVDVDRNTFFVAIRSEKQRAVPRPVWRSPFAGVVADARSLNLDDPRAQVPQNHRTERSREIAREVEYEHPF